MKGYKNGEHGDKLCQNGTAKSTLDEIAKELNMSTTNLKRVLRIERNLTDSMKELLDTGIKIKPQNPNYQDAKHQGSFLCVITTIFIKTKQMF